MSGDIVERLRNWDDGRVSTHYEGCWDSHPVCAILLAADEIEWLRALLADLLNDCENWGCSPNDRYSAALGGPS